MSGKGSRQRTYGQKFNDNYDRIFNKDKKEDKKPKLSHEPGMSTECLEERK